MLISCLKQLEKLMRKLMSNISKKKKELKDKIPKVVMEETVPEDIKMVFGKFCAYSFLYIGFFGVIYPFFLMYYLDKLFSIGLIVGLIVFERPSTTAIAFSNFALSISAFAASESVS